MRTDPRCPEPHGVRELVVRQSPELPVLGGRDPIDESVVSAPATTNPLQEAASCGESSSKVTHPATGWGHEPRCTARNSTDERQQ
jgi:hypothetical protein